MSHFMAVAQIFCTLYINSVRLYWDILCHGWSFWLTDEDDQWIIVEEQRSVIRCIAYNTFYIYVRLSRHESILPHLWVTHTQ